MWNDLRPEEMVGEYKIIDKLELVNGFLTDYKKIPLSSPEDLSKKLNEIKETKKSGVYGIYNYEKKEFLYVGESKNVKGRIRDQLIGMTNKSTKIPRFRRLFLSVIKKEKKIKQKDYYVLSDERKRELIEFYQKIIFTSNNFLRIHFTRDSMQAKVLEDTLVRYFKRKGQCKYNFQVG